MTIAHSPTSAFDCRSLAPVLEPDTSLAPVLLGVAPLSTRDVVSLREAAVAAGLTFVLVDSEEELCARLGVRPPRAVIFEDRRPDARRICGAVRGNPLTSSVALLALSDAPAGAFSRALSWGASDVVERAALGDLRRALRLLHGVPMTIAKPKGRAIVVYESDEARAVTASALSSAGFTVEVGDDAASLRAALCAAPAALVVAGASGVGDPILSELLHARAGGSLAPWILSLPHDSLDGARSLLESLPYVGIHDAETPPDGVLFLANEILHAGFADARATTRVLHAAPVRVRGADLDLAAFTYNVSEGGLFARTLTPLAQGLEVTLELDAPRTLRAVKLAAKVTWQRPFGPLGGAVSPPGIGFALTGPDTEDRAAYRAACAALAHAVAPPTAHAGGTLRPWPVSHSAR